MALSVFAQTYNELRKPIFYWTLVMVGVAGLIMLAFPLLDGPFDLDWLGAQRSASFLFGYEVGQLRLSHLGDWLQAVGFGLFFPLLLSVYASVVGSWLVAGEEERGSLGLLLAAPLARWRFMLEKSAVLLVSVLRPVLVLGLILWMMGLFGASVSGLVNLLLGLFLLSLLFGALALAVGSFRGRQRLSLGVTLGGLLMAFAISRLPPSHPVGQLLRLLSPVYLYEASAANPVFLLALLALVVICLVLAWVGFERRDLEV